MSEVTNSSSSERRSGDEPRRKGERDLPNPPDSLKALDAWRDSLKGDDCLAGDAYEDLIGEAPTPADAGLAGDWNLTVLVAECPLNGDDSLCLRGES